MVVHDEMEVEIGRDDRLDFVEDAGELDRLVPEVALADHCIGGDVECCERRPRAVSHVIMHGALDLARAHRQQRLAAVESLNLVDPLRRSTLVGAKHQSPL